MNFIYFINIQGLTVKCSHILRACSTHKYEQFLLWEQLRNRKKKLLFHTLHREVIELFYATAHFFRDFEVAPIVKVVRIDG